MSKSSKTELVRNMQVCQSNFNNFNATAIKALSHPFKVYLHQRILLSMLSGFALTAQKRDKFKINDERKNIGFDWQMEGLIIEEKMKFQLTDS